MKNRNYVIISIVFLSIAVIILALLMITSFYGCIAFPIVCFFIAPVLIAVSSIPPVVNYIQNNKRETCWGIQSVNKDDTETIIKNILIFTTIMTIGYPCFLLLSYISNILNWAELKRFFLFIMAAACLLQILTNLFMYIKTRLLSFAIAFITNVLAAIIFVAALIIFLIIAYYVLITQH